MSAQRKSGLLLWLRENGYFVPRHAEPLLGAYIAERWFFVAVKIHTDPESVQSLPPLALEFKTAVKAKLLDYINQTKYPSEGARILLDFVTEPTGQ